MLLKILLLSPNSTLYFSLLRQIAYNKEVPKIHSDLVSSCQLSEFEWYIPQLRSILKRIVANILNSKLHYLLFFYSGNIFLEFKKLSFLVDVIQPRSLASGIVHLFIFCKFSIHFVLLYAVDHLIVCNLKKKKI